MARIYKLSRTGLKLLYKIRYHKGHGIHSPFVYNLVRKVIEEKAPYYAYEDIKLVLDNFPGINLYPQKHNLLCFRFANYFNAKRILEIGSGYGVNTLYLTAPASNITCNCIEVSEKKNGIAKELYKNWNRNITLFTENKFPNFSEKQDCIYLDLNDYDKFPVNIAEYISNLSYENTFIIVKGIRTNKQHKMLWKSITNIEGRTAVLDLFNIGIMFFNKRLYKWDYKISF